MTEYKYKITVGGNTAELIIKPLPPEDELESFLERLRQAIKVQLWRELLKFVEQEWE